MPRPTARPLRITANVIGVLAFLVAAFPVYWMVNSSFLDRNEIRNAVPTWVPFGGGAHRCLGSALATLELEIAMAAIAVAFAAADTYVVVLALPDMMTGVGLGIDALQKATPIISGFLLGYVAMLPLIGRIADLRGRLPVLTAALVIFAVGSLVTALAYDLPSMVTGRFLQGIGGGGLVPATLALVADLSTDDSPAYLNGLLGTVAATKTARSA